MIHFLTYSLLSALLIFSKPSMAKETITPSDTNIGKNMKAKQYSDIYFSGQPDLNDLIGQLITQLISGKTDNVGVVMQTA